MSACRLARVAGWGIRGRRVGDGDGAVGSHVGEASFKAESSGTCCCQSDGCG